MAYFQDECQPDHDQLHCQFCERFANRFLLRFCNIKRSFLVVKSFAMQTRGLLRGPALPCTHASRSSPAATRPSHKVAAPNCFRATSGTHRVGCGRRRNVRALATSASVEDVEEKTSAAAPEASSDAAASLAESPLDAVELISEVSLILSAACCHDALPHVEGLTESAPAALQTRKQRSAFRFHEGDLAYVYIA